MGYIGNAPGQKDIAAYTNIGAQPAGSDELLLSDAGVLKAVTVTNLIAGAGGGKVLQVVSDNADTQYSTTSSTLQLVADPAVTITPANSSNKILIIGGIVGYNPADQTIIDLQRAISGGATTSGLSGQTHGMGFMEGGDNTMRQTLTYLDSPSTTSAVTYKFMFCNENNSQTIYIGNNTSQANLIAIEVDGT